MHWRRWIKHLLFWLFFWGARYYIQQITFNPYKQYPFGVLLNSLAATINLALAYYIIVGWIYPRWLKQKKYLISAAGFLLVIVLYTWLDYLTEQMLLRDARWNMLMQQYQPDYYNFLQRGVINSLLARILTLGIIYQLFLGLSLPLIIKVSVEYSLEKIKRAELARQNLLLELNFLRAQVNPHFLFNTLNNIYSLILHDKKNESADTVARLSAFMRYSLQEAIAETTSVEKEVRVMEDYVELEKIRLNHIQVKSNFTVNGGNQLPPLLLIPFLENAFKYCPDKNGSYINIHFRSAPNILEFSCSNTYDPDATTTASGGIGLNNIGRRLEQHYSGDYDYKVSCENNIYSINLFVTLP